jgi:hypothetical protein
LIDHPCLAVPEHIFEDRRLSLQARCVLTYMLGLSHRHHKVIPIKDHVLPTMGVSAECWDRIRSELEKAGYLQRVTTRGTDGLITNTHLITDDPMSTLKGFACR